MNKRVAPAEQQPTGPVPGGSAGTPDAARMTRLDELHERAMAAYDGKEAPEEPEVKRELVNQPHDPATGKFMTKDPEAAPEAKVEEPAAEPEAPEAPAEPEPQPELYEIKVNGRTLKLTKEELIARAQKVEAADQYLQQAAQQFKAAKPEEPKAPEQKASVEEDDAALARAIQMGTEEEAREAIKKLRARPPQGLTQDDVLRAVDQRIAFQDAARRFQTEFKDVFEDPYLLQLAMNEDQRLIQTGDQRDYWTRFQEVGTKVREWVGKFKSQPVSSDKQQRKATVTPIPTAAARAAGVTEEKPETHADVVAQMAAKRQAR